MPEGNSRGAVFAAVNFTDRKDSVDMDRNTLFEQILAMRVSGVAIRGRLTDVSEIREILAGLAAKGRAVVYITDADDDIQTIRMLRNVSIIMETVPPNSKTNKIRASNFPMLREQDVVLIKIAKTEDYDAAMDFLRGRAMMTRPTVVLSIAKPFSGVEEIITRFMTDVTTVKCRIRMSTPGALHLGGKAVSVEVEEEAEEEVEEPTNLQTTPDQTPGANEIKE